MICVVISYDIKDDERRTQIHKLLKNYGKRVQYSVFECVLTLEQYLRLRDKLNRLIKKEQSDNIRFYFLCAQCQNKVEWIGADQPFYAGPIII